MALTGRFLADFSPFYAAVQQAEVKLVSMGTGAANVEKRLNRMVDNFSGRKVVAEATVMVEAVERIGGAAKLTEAELARVSAKASEAVFKLKAMGQEVPAGLEKLAGATSKASGGLSSMLGMAGKLAGVFGVAFSVTQVVSWSKAILDAADSLVKLSDQTGMTIEEVQKLDYIASQSGNTVEELASAVARLQVNLSDPKAVEALERLGISVEDFKRASPYEALLQISDGLKTIGSSGDQARVAYELLGRKGLEILPTLKSDMRALGDAAGAAKDAQVRALDEMGDALGRAEKSVKNWALATAGNIAMVGEKYGWLKTMAAGIASAMPGGQKYLLDMTRATQEAAAAKQKDAEATAAQGRAAQQALDPGTQYRIEIERLNKAFAGLTDQKKRDIEAGVAAKKSASEIASDLTINVNVVERYIDSLKKKEQASKDANTEAERMAKVERELASVGATWQETLSRINPEIVEAVKRYREAGIEEGILAEKYKLTAAQVKAVSQALAEEKKALEDEQKAVKDTREELAKMELARANLTRTTREQREAELRQREAAMMGKLTEAGVKDPREYEAVQREFRAQLQAMSVDWDALRSKSIQTLRDQATEAENTYQRARAASGQYSASAIEDFRKTAVAAKKALDEALADTPEKRAAKRIEEENQKLYQFLDTMGAGGVVAKDTFDKIKGGADNAANAIDGTTRATERLVVGLNSFQGAWDTYDKARVAMTMDEKYRQATMWTGNVTPGMSSMWQEALWREGKSMPTSGMPILSEAEAARRSQPWGYQGGTYNFNVNVNNEDAEGIANGIMSGLRHQGVRFGR